MKPQKHVMKKSSEQRKELRKSRFQIVKLEQRIAPGMRVNHNEVLVRDVAKAPKKLPTQSKTKSRRLQIVKLEQRIAPGREVNHNETLVQDV